jgi:hypothetical protein
MNDSKKMAIIIAVVFFLAGTVLNIDYAMWNEKIYTEYQESTPYICWSLHDDINKCPEEMRTHIEYNDWKFYNGKSYWKDLAGRLSVMEVSAYGEPAEYNYTLQVEDNIEWSTYTPSNATYTDVIPQPIYYVRHRGPSLDLPEGAEVTINVTFYEEGYNATPPEEEYKWSDDDLNISQWDDEYPPKEPKLTELDGDWSEVDDTNTTESTHLEHSKRVKIESNTSCMDCWYYPDEDRFVCAYNGYCGCGDSNCEGDPEYNEGCVLEEYKWSDDDYNETLDDLQWEKEIKEQREEDEFTWYINEEYSTQLNVSITELNLSDYQHKTLYIPSRECCEEPEHFIISKEYTYVSETIYVMQVSSGWDYHTFKLPIYRRI